MTGDWVSMENVRRRNEDTNITSITDRRLYWI